jgi:serine/threonine protein kinase
MNNENEPQNQFGEVFGRFRVLELIGGGAFTRVHRAIDTETGKVVALTLFGEGVLDTEESRASFLEAARCAMRLAHDHIVPVYEVGGTREHPFVVSAFINGPTLRLALTSRKFTPGEASAIVRAMANALQYVHERGIIHRDVKSSNISLDECSAPFLTGFDPQVVGTPAYMSPEQVERRSVDGRTDVYSLGVVLYEITTGELPFRGSLPGVWHQIVHTPPRSPSAVNPTVPPDLEKICLKCLRKAPGDRYASAAELEDDLSRFMEGRPISD